MQFGLRAAPVKREIPSATLRAGSSLRLKNSYARDDAAVQEGKLRHYPKKPSVRARFGAGAAKTAEQ